MARIPDALLSLTADAYAAAHIADELLTALAALNIRAGGDLLTPEEIATFRDVRAGIYRARVRIGAAAVHLMDEDDMPEQLARTLAERGGF
jgi:hypothetical protein